MCAPNAAPRPAGYRADPSLTLGPTPQAPGTPPPQQTQAKTTSVGGDWQSPTPTPATPTPVNPAASETVNPTIDMPNADGSGGYRLPPQVTTPQSGGAAPPTGTPGAPRAAPQATSKMYMSDWGGQGNVFDPGIMAANGWGFDPKTGAWNGPIPDEYKNTAPEGDGFTGIRDNIFYVNGRSAIGGNYLGGTLDPNNLGAMGGGGTMRDMLGTQGFIGRGSGGGGGLMAQAAPAAGPGFPGNTSPSAAGAFNGSGTGPGIAPPRYANPYTGNQVGAGGTFTRPAANSPLAGGRVDGGGGGGAPVGAGAAAAAGAGAASPSATPTQTPVVPTTPAAPTVVPGEPVTGQQPTTPTVPTLYTTGSSAVPTYAQNPVVPKVYAPSASTAASGSTRNAISSALARRYKPQLWE